MFERVRLEVNHSMLRGMSVRIQDNAFTYKNVL